MGVLDQTASPCLTFSSRHLQPPRGLPPWALHLPHSSLLLLQGCQISRWPPQHRRHPHPPLRLHPRRLLRPHRLPLRLPLQGHHPHLRPLLCWLLWQLWRCWLGRSFASWWQALCIQHCQLRRSHRKEKKRGRLGCVYLRLPSRLPRRPRRPLLLLPLRHLPLRLRRTRAPNLHIYSKATQVSDVFWRRKSSHLIRDRRVDATKIDMKGKIGRDMRLSMTSKAEPGINSLFFLLALI
jgi:hypothetical protein